MEENSWMGREKGVVERESVMFLDGRTLFFVL